MPGTRLFIGGLSSDLQESELREQLAQFGAVVGLDIKEKKDLVTGEIIKRFAFATLDGTGATIDQCISSLDGKVINGSTLSVGRAQESFIERLAREREARKLGIEIPPPKSDVKFSSHRQDSYLESQKQQVWKTNQQSSGSEQQSWQSSRQQSDDRTGNSYNSSSAQSWDRRQNHYEDSYQDNHRDQVSDTVLPSLETHSSLWGDGDGVDTSIDQAKRLIDTTKSSESGPTTKKLKVMKRYDPTKAAAAETEQPTKKPAPSVVSKGLTFTGASSSFSLLAAFGSSIQEPVVVTAEPVVPEEVPPPATTAESASDQEVAQPCNDTPTPAALVRITPTTSETSPVKPQASETSPVTEIYRKPYINETKFFIDEDDPEIEENLCWLYTREITESQKQQFEKDKLEIRKMWMNRMRDGRRVGQQRGSAGWCGALATLVTDFLPATDDADDTHTHLVSNGPYKAAARRRPGSWSSRPARGRHAGYERRGKSTR